MSTPIPGYQLIPVPERHVGAVYRLIADLESGGSGAAGDYWTSSALARIAAGDTETTRILSELLDELTKAPGVEHDLDQLSDATGRDRGQLRYVWTHVSRHLKAHFDNAPSPIERVLGSGGDGLLDGVSYYLVDDVVAQRWAGLRAPR